MYKLLIFFLLMIPISLLASHNRAGEITYEQIAPLTIVATITTFSDASATTADRNSLQLFWGDGSDDMIFRVNGEDSNGDSVPDGELLANGYKVNVYIRQHTYASLGDYVLSMQDPNRNEGILNINAGMSAIAEFYLETEFSLESEINSSPIILEAPIDIAVVGMPFSFIPNAFDADGDSIAYELVTPLMDHDLEVPNYLPLTSIEPGANNDIVFESEVGLMVWESPQLAGEYSVAIRISTYREGEINCSIILDYLILVKDEDNIVPGISFSTTIGDQVQNLAIGSIAEIGIAATDSNLNQDLTLTSSSALYNLFSNTATFNANTQVGNSVNAAFTFEATEEHIRDQPYQVVFKVSDELGAARYAVFRYKISGTVNVENLESNLKEKLLFPNPCTESIFTGAKGEFEIFNLQGKVIQKGILNNANIDVQHLEKGSYYLRIDNSSQLFLKI